VLVSLLGLCKVQLNLSLVFNHKSPLHLQVALISFLLQLAQFIELSLFEPLKVTQELPALPECRRLLLYFLVVQSLQICLMLPIIHQSHILTILVLLTRHLCDTSV